MTKKLDNAHGSDTKKSMSDIKKPWDDWIIACLDQPVGEQIKPMIERLAERPGVAAILFYGNRLRESEAQGLLDLYVLTDSDPAYHGHGPSAFFNRLLPPNVYHEDAASSKTGIGAKVAVISLAAFRRRMRKASWDTTLWARFAQPAILGYARDADARARVIEAITAAYQTATWWAAHFSDDQATAHHAWETLFSKTYGVELRVESAARAKTIVDQAPALYAALHEAIIEPLTPSESDRRTAIKAWNRRKIAGKLLNVARLIKAATTFKGGISYALSKVERHSGRPVQLKAWQRRFPWLAVPFVFLRLIFERRLR